MDFNGGFFLLWDCTAKTNFWPCWIWFWISGLASYCMGILVRLEMGVYENCKWSTALWYWMTAKIVELRRIWRGATCWLTQLVSSWSWTQGISFLGWVGGLSLLYQPGHGCVCGTQVYQPIFCPPSLCLRMAGLEKIEQSKIGRFCSLNSCTKNIEIGKS